MHRLVVFLSIAHQMLFWFLCFLNRSNSYNSNLLDMKIWTRIYFFRPKMLNSDFDAIRFASWKGVTDCYYIIGVECTLLFPCVGGYRVDSSRFRLIHSFLVGWIFPLTYHQIFLQGAGCLRVVQCACKRVDRPLLPRRAITIGTVPHPTQMACD